MKINKNIVEINFEMDRDYQKAILEFLENEKKENEQILEDLRYKLNLIKINLFKN